MIFRLLQAKSGPLAWVASRGPHVIPLPGSSYVLPLLRENVSLKSILTVFLLRRYRTKARLVENLAAGDLVLSAEDVAKIDAVI